MTVVMAKYPQVEIGGVPGEGNFLRCFSELNIALRMVFIGVYAYTVAGIKIMSIKSVSP